MDVKIHGYEVRDVMLDLKFDENILLNKSWEIMGRPRLVYSPIQLWLVSQHIIYFIDHLQYVEVNLGTMKTM
jgi:hypothetical protein